MAAGGSRHIDLSVTSRPPSGKTNIIYDDGFRYRGKLFLAGSQRSCNEPHSYKKRHVKKCTDVEGSREKIDHVNSLPSDETVHQRLREPRKIQSATARLERNNSKEIRRSVSSDAIQELGEKRPSVINLDEITDVPDHEEEMLLRAASVRVNSAKYRDKFLTTRAIRPSSAKGAIGCPVVKTEESSSSPAATEKIKPSVFGLRIGRQVCGSGPEALEAWKQTDHNFPYKLSDENSENDVKELVLKNERRIPTTLHPLAAWHQEAVASCITGLEPSMCLIFLSHDYQGVDLPEVPMPQTATDDLPYTHIVETPRQKVAKRYSHPFFEKDFDHENWKCRHTDSVIYSGAIPSYANHSGPRTSEKIRKEIQELEDLLNGIGSLTSNCSFVQFQAEIHTAKALAAKLSSLKARKTEEEQDTFGLLKLYRDHEKIIGELHQRRDECLQELSLLENT